MQNLVPGTTIPYDGKSGMFSMFRPLIQATDGLTLSQVCTITGLEPSTIQNWVKRKFVPHPVNKKYRERQLARILLISSLRECMKIDSIGELMGTVNGDADDTSDDIISEERMYDYLCEATALVNEADVSVGKIPGLVRQVIMDYSAPSDEALERLAQALEVMVYAYIAGKYKQQADKLLAKIKERS